MSIRYSHLIFIWSVKGSGLAFQWHTGSVQRSERTRVESDWKGVAIGQDFGTGPSRSFISSESFYRDSSIVQRPVELRFLSVLSCCWVPVSGIALVDFRVIISD